MTSWHYAVNGQAQGPIPEQQLRDLLAHGGLGPDTLLWTEGMAQWQKASEIALFAAPPPAAPPPSYARPTPAQSPARPAADPTAADPTAADPTAGPTQDGGRRASPTRHDTGFTPTATSPSAAELRLDHLLRQSLSILRARLGFWLITGLIGTLVMLPIAVLIPRSGNVIGIIVQTQINAMLTYAAFQACGGRDFRFGDAFQKGSDRFLPFLGITGLVFLAVLILFLAAAVLGYLFGLFFGNPVSFTLFTIACFVLTTMGFVRAFVSMAVCTAEKAGPIVSLTRSFQLTDGSSWRIFGLFLILAVPLVLLGLIASAIVSAVATISATAVAATIGLLLLAAAPMQWLFNAFVIILSTSTYVELRRNTEGFTSDAIAEVFE